MCDYPKPAMVSLDFILLLFFVQHFIHIMLTVGKNEYKNLSLQLETGSFLIDYKTGSKH